MERELEDIMPLAEQYGLLDSYENEKLIFFVTRKPKMFVLPADDLMLTS